MKSKLTLADCIAEMRDLKQLVLGMRVNNIYDIDEKVFLLKFAEPGRDKQLLLIESGVRMHTTIYSRNKPVTPGNFCIKLRKHIRGRRLTRIELFGGGLDRVIDMQFGTGDAEYHLLVELYDRGNVILTDKHYIIMAVLRKYSLEGPSIDDSSKLVIAVKQKYTIMSASLSKDENCPFIDVSQDVLILAKQIKDYLHWYEHVKMVSLPSKVVKKSTIVSALSSRGSGCDMYGPLLLLHAVLSSGIKLDTPFSSNYSDESLTLLAKSISALPAFLLTLSESKNCVAYAFVEPKASATQREVVESKISSLSSPFLGTWDEIQLKYKTILKASPPTLTGNSRIESSPVDDENDADVVSSQVPSEIPYDIVDFSPFLFSQYVEDISKGSVKYIEFPSFNYLCDEYFSRLDVVKAEKNEIATKSAASKRLERIREGHSLALKALDEAYEDAYTKGSALEANLEVVNAACLVIRSALEHGVDWNELNRMVETEKSNGNPVARLIMSMDLPKGTIVIALERNSYDDSDEIEESDALDNDDPLLIEVNVFETAATNAANYYALGKQAREKSSKTAASSDVALKQAEKSVLETVTKQMAAASASKLIHVARKQAWYERFHWFITSEGLIVVAGKNAQDNELLWKRYLRPQDAYVHADIHGAATCILRNHSNNPADVNLLPQLSLEQAGAFCVALSSAWTSKLSTGSWWVSASQVSKTAPSGEYLTTGAFMIRGKKRLLPPSKLELGIGLLWRVDESCASQHVGDRYIRGLRNDNDEVDDVIQSLSEKSGVEDEHHIFDSLPSDEAIETSEFHTDDNDADKLVNDNAAKDVIDSGSSDVVDENIPVGGDVKLVSVAVTGVMKREAKQIAKKKGIDLSIALKKVAIESALKKDGVKGEETHDIKKRGHHGKKKALKKYVDQDEDEKLKAAEIIGHGFGSTHVEETIVVPIQQEQMKKSNAKLDKTNNSSKGEGKKPSSSKANDAHETSEPTLDADTGNLSTLVSSPLKEDIILHLVPMLCPYSVALQCKYRVKLLPGGLKKGKAAQQVVSSFLTLSKDPSSTPRERDLIKILTETEVVNVILGNSRVESTIEKK
jgi:predicted ribosome quality control (RQC) complex YloA/Tae2 family protein